MGKKSANLSYCKKNKNKIKKIKIKQIEPGLPWQFVFDLRCPTRYLNKPLSGKLNDPSYVLRPFGGGKAQQSFPALSTGPCKNTSIVGGLLPSWLIPPGIGVTVVTVTPLRAASFSTQQQAKLLCMDSQAGDSKSQLSASGELGQVRQWGKKKKKTSTLVSHLI